MSNMYMFQMLPMFNSKVPSPQFLAIYLKTVVYSGFRATVINTCPLTWPPSRGKPIQRWSVVRGSKQNGAVMIHIEHLV